MANVLDGDLLALVIQAYRELGARHQIPATAASLDDTHHAYTQTLFETVMAACRVAHDHNLSELDHRHGPEAAYRFHRVWPGEHYRLLYGLCEVLKPKVVVEIGTSTGLSSAAMLLGLPEVSRLVTFDIVPLDTFNAGWVAQKDIELGRFRQVLADLKNPATFQDHAELFAEADFIFIDGPKDLTFERAILASLRGQTVNRPRTVLFDDIRGPLVDRFWREIDLPKLDITSFGHWSGSGILELPATQP